MKSSEQKNPFLLPLILLVLLFVILTGLISYIVYLQTPDEPDALPTPAASSEVRETPKPTVSDSPVPTETATPVPAADASPTPAWQFTEDSNRFWADNAIKRAGSYKSPGLSVRVETTVDTETYGRRVTYYVADIYVRDVTQIKTASCNGDFSRNGSGSVKKTAKNVNALVAISGDYCGFQKNTLVIRNGTVYRSSLRSDMDVCLLLKDGTMKTYRGGSISLREILTYDVWQAWQFGPALLTDEGDARTSFPGTSIGGRNPRCCIGYVDPGHYKFVVADGRQKESRGLTLSELAALMETLGCRSAFNLDGGASAHFYWNDEIYSNPSKGGRNISDIIYVEKESYPDSDFFHGKDGMHS